MKNFFTVIIIIAVSVVVFLAYYSGKNLYSRYRQERLESELNKKRYEDEKKYIRHYFRTLLSDLEAGKLYWIQVFSQMYPETKLEIIFNSIDKLIQIQHRIRDVNDKEIIKLKNLGLKSHFCKNGLYCFCVSLNSTIVTDVIYFFLEQVGEQKHARNIKIVTSGG